MVERRREWKYFGRISQLPLPSYGKRIPVVAYRKNEMEIIAYELGFPTEARKQTNQEENPELDQIVEELLSAAFFGKKKQSLDLQRILEPLKKTLDWQQFEERNKTKGDEADPLD